MQMLVLNFVVLNHLVGLKDRVLLNLDCLMDESLDDSNAHVIIRGLLFMVDRDQVQVNDEQNSVDFKLTDDFLEDLAELE